MAKMNEVFKDISSVNGKCFLVGGAVRDKFRGLKPKDKDYLVTGLTGESLVSVLNKHGHVKLVGESFGVYKFVQRGTTEVHDFALPRKETSTGVGHADFEVDAGPHITVEEDLSRRDFTCNSIAVDVLTGEIVDPFNGVADIAANRLALVFDRAFREDPLRMLRACQFAARLGFQPTDHMLQTMRQDAHLIESVSAERTAIELCKLMKAPLPSVGFRIMRNTGVLRFAWPELADLVGLKQNPAYHAFDVFEHSIRACDAIPARGKNMVWRRILAVSHDIGKKKRRQFKNLIDQFREDGLYEVDGDFVIVTSIPWAVQTFTMEEAGQPQFIGHDDAGADMFKVMFSRMKFSSVTDEAVPGIYFPSALKMEALIKNHMFMCDFDSTPKSLRKFVKTVGKDSVFDQIRLRIADRSAKGLEARTDVSEWLAFAKRIRTLSHGQKAPAAFSLKDLAVKGNDLMAALNIKPGPAIGKILNTLLDHVIEDPEANTRVNLLALATDLHKL